MSNDADIFFGELEHFSKLYADSATQLSKQIDELEERLTSLSGKAEVSAKIPNSNQYLSFKRLPGPMGWGLAIVGPGSTPDLPLRNASVEWKLRAIAAIPSLLQAISGEFKKAELIAEAVRRMDRILAEPGKGA